MNKIPESVIEEIKEKTDIVQVVGEYVTLKNKGSNLWGLCPFHNEKTPSFSVTPSKDIFYCFGCHQGGNIFKFIMEIEKLSFPEAVRFLAEKNGVKIDEENTPVDGKKEGLKDLYTRVSNLYIYLLENSKEAEPARAYLSERGFSGSSIKDFGLGFAPYDRKWLFQFLRKKNYSEEFLRDSGLFSARYPEITLFSGRIMFPIRGLHGQVVAFSGRLLRGDGPKYINTPETSLFKKGSTLYGLDLALPEIRKTRKVILCEGNMDVMALHQSGVTDSVAPLGTAFTSGQAHIIKRYADKCIIMFDGDTAGIKAAERAVSILQAENIESEHIELPSGSDPADIMKKDGPESLKNLLKYHINSFEYLLEKYILVYKLETIEGKKAVMEAIFPYIRLGESEVERESRLVELSDRLGVESKSVMADYYKKNDLNKRHPEDSERKKNIELNTDLFLIVAIIANRQYFTIVRNVLHVDDLEDIAAKNLYISLEECYREDDLSVDGILEKVDDEAYKALILEKLSSEEFQINNERLIKDAVYKIKSRKIKGQIKDLLQRIDHADSKGNAAMVNEYLLEKMHLDEELEKIKVIDDDRAGE